MEQGPDGNRASRLLWLAWLLALACLPPVQVAADDFQTPAITAQELSSMRGRGDEPLVVDVRKSGEYKSGHVPGAVNIPHDKLEKRLDELRAAKGVVLYCIAGSRTRLAEQTLIENDVANVFHLEGGLLGWRKSGLKVQTGWGP